MIHTALTRLPLAWRRLDANLAGRTGIAGIMTPPAARTAVALAARLPGRAARTPVPSAPAAS
ncbi:hypothetical protein ABZ177_24585 [Streptomyces sp. NPDC006284]|uniref:hypothetical protein n=1 Tax=unclassified Streptomyces TaxID=2593676 RepID=UPI0033B6027B